MRPRTKAWWHGGVPDLRPGDLIEPGHERAAHQPRVECGETLGAAFDAPAVFTVIGEHMERLREVVWVPVPRASVNPEYAAMARTATEVAPEPLVVQSVE